MNLVDFGVFLATPADALRLLIIPVFAWVAWKDIKTRRVPNRTWLPLLAVGGALLAWEAWQTVGTLGWQSFAVSAGLSIFVVVPAAYLMWLVGGFGGADAKAIMTLAVFFPTYPAYYAGSTELPLIQTTTVGSFSFTILANAVALAVILPFGLALANLFNGDYAKVMFLGQKQQTDTVAELPGKLLETPKGYTRSGLDLDTLRMYLRWRDTTITDIQADAHAFRHPTTIPEDPSSPTDGALRADGGEITIEPAPEDSDPQTPSPNEGAQDESTAAEQDAVDVEEEENPDWWGADEFLGDVEYAYGTTPDQLRQGLEVLAQRDTVWVSPGTPFMVPIFAGIMTGLVYGNVIFGVLSAVGAV